MNSTNKLNISKFKATSHAVTFLYCLNKCAINNQAETQRSEVRVCQWRSIFENKQIWEFRKHFIICLPSQKRNNSCTKWLNARMWMSVWACVRVFVRVCMCVCPQLVTISANHVGNVKAGNGLKEKLQYRIKPCNGKLCLVGFCECTCSLSHRAAPGGSLQAQSFTNT